MADEQQQDLSQGTTAQPGVAAPPPYTFDFGLAVSLLKLGKKVARLGWNAHHSLALKQNTVSQTTLPYVYMVIGNDATDLQGKIVPWVCSHTDMLADDWVEITN